MRKESLAELRKKRMKERNQKLIAVVIAGAIAAILFMNNTKVDANSMVYTVKKKDTLYSLSKKFHVTEKQLKEANGLPSGKDEFHQKANLLQTVDKPKG
ncbi:LysM peptidoglycan-binding domain-containing protein [Neobacillus niacini]|uniref:LysM peptidoglycan-binding domain-containing protein n=1 Tax=Neobacillus niacini TaxID=86668 RepID=UPI00255A133D|nr:LysM peptidoglycan-binding domain-containing protein [Neobacillus niacini]